MNRYTLPVIVVCLILLRQANAQFVQQGNKLVGSGAVGGAEQGWSVSLSSDGNTAIVGGRGDSSSVGAAWVWTRSGGVWTREGAKLVGSGAVGNAEQGFSVSLSSDGNTAIVGGSGDNSSVGAAWVWTRSGGVWTQQGTKLVGSDAVGSALQGGSVSLSADGNTAIVGGNQDSSFAGAAWVWTRSGGVWTQQGTKLVGTGAGGVARQGISVSLSSDGNTAIVGGSGDNISEGAAWVWTRSGGVWTQQGTKLVGTGAVGSALQGRSVSLSSDGNTAIVGGSGDSSFAGAAWVWIRSGGVWTQQGTKLVGSGAVGNAFQGISVSLSSDGNTAIVGGSGDNSSEGAAWVWTRSGGEWTQRGTKRVGTGAVGGAQQGASVSLSSDGNTAIVGGYQDSSSAGAAWVFAYSDTPPTVQASNVVFSAISDSSLTVQWTNGDGEYRLVAMMPGSQVDDEPIDSTTYSASATFGLGDEMGSSGSVVFAGTDNSLTVTGLLPGTTYHVAVFEFNGSSGFERYLTTNAATGNGQTLITLGFEGPGGVGSKDGTSRLKLWLKADAGVTVETGVSEWADQSGSGNNATAPGNQPTLEPDVLNGKPVVRFVATSSQYLQTGSIPAFDTDLFSWFLVVKSTNAQQVYLRSNYTSNSIQWGSYTELDLFQSHARTSAGSFRGSSNPYNVDYNIISAGWNAANEITQYLNDSLGTTGSGADAAPTGHNFTRIGANSSATPGLFTNGDIAEVIVFTTELNTTQRILIENYLSAKYALSLNSNVKYNGHDPAYTFSVAGIGREASGSHLEAHSDGIVLQDISALDTDEKYFMVGHAGTTGTIAWTDLPAGVAERWERDWYLKKSGSPGSGTLTISFDYSAVGLGSAPALASSEYRLLYRSNDTETFSTVMNLSAGVENNRVKFVVSETEISDGYYTLGVGSLLNSALMFDGANDQVFITTPGKDDFTIEFWMNTNATGGTGDHWWSGKGLVDYEIGGVANDFGTSLLGNKVAFGVGNPDVTIVSTSVVNDGEWHHVAATRKQSSGEIHLYVDGELQGSTTANTNTLLTDFLLIGSLRTSVEGSFFQGTLDEIRIWHVVRDSSEIRRDMHTVYASGQTGLIGYWQLNDGIGSTARDGVGNNHGTLDDFDFVETSGWVTSTAPIGTGIAASVLNFTSGTANLGAIAITTTDDFDQPVDLFVSQLHADPNTAGGTVGNIASGLYWAFNLFGSPGTFSVSLTFTFPEGAISAADIATPSNLKLYSRSSFSDSNWTEVATASNATETTVTFEGISSFSQFTVGSESSPLPVQMSAFSASANRMNAELRWRTESEQSNHGFEIERRSVTSSELRVTGSNQLKTSNTQHATQWATIGFMPGAGTSTSPKEYSFADKNMTPGRYAYRIKQIDHSGAFVYTDALELEVGLAPMEFNLAQNYPNPFNPTTTIEFTLPQDSRVVLKIYNLQGQEVATLVNEERKAGVYHQVIFDASRLASGVYFSRLQAGSHQSIKKIVLIR